MGNRLLDSIVATKNKEITERRNLYPVPLLERSLFFNTPIVSLKKYLRRADLVGVIAEIKRRSPSRGVLKERVNIEDLSIGYMQSGASALSVLTDAEHFGGSSEDLSVARRFNFCPILRKEFIVDEYQLIESRSIGADVVLLIARILTPAQLKQLTQTARALGLEVLIEIHTAAELAPALEAEPDLVGVNNRDLDTLQINLDLSRTLGSQIPQSVTKISESGLDSAATINELKSQGYDGFLIGEAFMRSASPAESCRRLIDAIKEQRPDGQG